MSERLWGTSLGPDRMGDAEESPVTPPRPPHHVRPDHHPLPSGTRDDAAGITCGQVAGLIERGEL